MSGAKKSYSQLGWKYNQPVSSLDSPGYFQGWDTAQFAHRTMARDLKVASRENETARDECNRR